MQAAQPRPYPYPGRYPARPPYGYYPVYPYPYPYPPAFGSPRQQQPVQVQPQQPVRVNGHVTVGNYFGQPLTVTLGWEQFQELISTLRNGFAQMVNALRSR